LRPPCVYATVPTDAHPDLLGVLHGRWRVATRLVMILLSARGFPAAQVAELLGYHPRTVRRWIRRYQQHGIGGLADRPRCGRPRLGSRRLAQRIRRLLATPRAWTIGRLYVRLGRPAISQRTLHRRVREVASWRRPRLVAKGDPDRDQVLAGLRQTSTGLPAGSVVLAADETHLHLLAWVRATWIARGSRQRVMTPGTNRRRSVVGAIDLASGRFVYRVARKAVSATCIAFCEQLLAAYRRRRWWRWSATTSPSTTPSWSRPGWPPIPGSWCCTGALQPPRQPDRAGLGRAQGVAGQPPNADHPGTRPPGARLLPSTHTRPAAGHCRTAQLTVAARGLPTTPQGGRLGQGGRPWPMGARWRPMIGVNAWARVPLLVADVRRSW
jgi:transposase